MSLLLEEWKAGPKVMMVASWMETCTALELFRGERAGEWNK